MRIFKGLFRGKPLKARFPHAVPTYYEKRKNADFSAFFCALSVGASAPNPDTRNFSRKVSWNFKSFRQSEVLFLSEVLWNFKSFAEVKWYVRWEILLPTFLTRKVGGTPFSERKVWSGKV